MRTLVIDTGQNIVGVFCVEKWHFLAYSGSDFSTALRLIQMADEVVTYNGKHHDLAFLGRLAGQPGDLSLNGIHTDMRSVCWSDRIWGSSLQVTYGKHFDTLPQFDDSHEGSVERDVFMTFKLWELWKLGKLKIIDGQHQ